MSDIKPTEDDMYTGSPMDPNYRLYVPLLNSLDVTIEEHDRLFAGQSSILVKGEPLVIASNRRMRTGDLQGVVGFHPLSEDIRNGASGVHDRLCSLVAQKLTSSISTLAIAIATIAANPDLQKELTPSALTVVKPLENFDLRALKKLTEFIKSIGPAKTRRLVKLHLKRSYVADGNHYERVCRVTFPLLEELGKSDDSILGVECRKKDPELLRRLFRVILPNYKTETSAYHGPSNSTIAPFFDAILEAYIRVASDINKVIIALADSSEIDEVRDRIDLSWESARKDYEPMLLRMRALPGNTGAPGLAESRQNANAAVDITPPPSPQPSAQPAQPPYPQSQSPIPAAAPAVAPYPQTQPAVSNPNVVVDPLFSTLYPNIDPGKVAATQTPPAYPFHKPGGYPATQPAVNPVAAANGFAALPQTVYPATAAPATPNGFPPGAQQFPINNPYMVNSVAAANGFTQPQPMMGGVPIPSQPPHPQYGYGTIPAWQQNMGNLYQQPYPGQPMQPPLTDSYGRQIQPAQFSYGGWPNRF